MSDTVESLIRQAIHTLTVPAAEYVPAIPDAWAILERALRLAASPTAQGEFVSVPREATEAMLERAMKDCGSIGAGSCGEHSGVDWDDFRCVWDAMIQAAPPAPSGVKVAEASYDAILTNAGTDRPRDTMATRSSPTILLDALATPSPQAAEPVPVEAVSEDTKLLDWLATKCHDTDADMVVITFMNDARGSLREVIRAAIAASPSSTKEQP